MVFTSYEELNIIENNYAVISASITKLEEAYYNIVTMMLWLLIDFIGQVILEII